MIFTNHHLLYRLVGRDGQFLEADQTRVWWSRRAIAEFTPSKIVRASDTDIVRRNLQFTADMAPYEVPDWERLYAHRLKASRAAVEMALERGLPVYNAVFDHDSAACDDVIDWLNMLSSENHRFLTKLSRISWGQAVLHARKWQRSRERERLAMGRIAQTEGTTKILDCGKYSWWRLETVAAIRSEGVAMENCLVEGHHDGLAKRGADGRQGLFSLRDDKGRSVLTALIASGLLLDVLERRNRPPRDHSQDHIEALTDHVF